MEILQKQEYKIQLFTGITCSVLLAIAYLSHLGYLPLSTVTDEPRRALVAAEMMISGDYITPTINGEIYLNKPPLYNWMVIAYFKLFGSYSMFAFRLPVILATLGMSLTVFYFTRKFTNNFVAFFTAFAYATNGRILIYDSLQGLIDTSFAWLVYLNFMLVYFLGKKQKYTSLFLITYLITAATYMMKGLPAFVFQGITLLTYFILTKNFKALFKPAHFIALGGMFLLLGIYYYLYFTQNNLPPSTLFTNIFNESAKRTGVVFGFWATVLHLITFPFEMLYHYAPWTIFFIVLIRKNTWKYIQENAFIQYTFWVFLTNFFIYWSSPQVYARYLFMFLPLIFSIFFYLYDDIAKTNGWQQQIINKIVLWVSLLVTACIPLFPLLPFTNVVPDVFIKTIVLFLAFGAVVYYMIKYKQWRLYTFLFAIVFARFAFNWFVIPQRGEVPKEAVELSKKILRITDKQSLYVLKGARFGTADALSFHLGTRRNEVLRYADGSDKNAFYIADVKQLRNAHYTEYLQFRTYMSDSLKLVKFR